MVSEQTVVVLETILAILLIAYPIVGIIGFFLFMWKILPDFSNAVYDVTEVTVEREERIVVEEDR